jgi:N-acetylglucosaminyltransferase
MGGTLTGVLHVVTSAGTVHTLAPTWPRADLTWLREHWRQYVPVGLVGFFSWGIWLVRLVMAHTARPVLNRYSTTTSVVVPCYREDPDVLMRCLASWLAQDPDEIVVVLDVEDEDAARRLLEVRDQRLHVIVFRHEGKRSALGVGIRAAQHELLVLTDSDTSWEPGLLAAVQMPFADPLVGAVGTRQVVYARSTSVWRRLADWILTVRYLDYVPAMGRVGAVICVSGRTAAYRRSAVLPVLSNLEHEFFLGRRCISGDDGRLTWLVLASGFKTVHQHTAVAQSMFPDTARGFFRQRVRWSRNSYRTYLTAVWKGWLFRQPLISQVTAVQILLTPLTMGLALYFLVRTTTSPYGAGLRAAVVWILLARALRGLSALRRHPGDLLLLPLLALVVIVVALPVKTYALLTMNRQGWITRRSSQIGGDGQTELSTLAGGPRG